MSTLSCFSGMWKVIPDDIPSFIFVQTEADPAVNFYRSHHYYEAVQETDYLKVHGKYYNGRKIKLPFSDEERNAVHEGVEEFGVGNWVRILQAYPEVLRNRTNVNIKDCYRTMLRQGVISPLAGRDRPPITRKSKRFTNREKIVLVLGQTKYGHHTRPWKHILEEYSMELQGRTEAQLRECFRSMKKSGKVETILSFIYPNKSAGNIHTRYHY